MYFLDGLEVKVINFRYLELLHFFERNIYLLILCSLKKDKNVHYKLERFIPLQ